MVISFDNDFIRIHEERIGPDRFTVHVGVMNIRNVFFVDIDG